jgi:hypothetical protein
MANELRKILLELVSELEDLRANQAVIVANASHPPTTADAREAKNLAMQASKKSYDQLRSKIETLSL